MATSSHKERAIDFGEIAMIHGCPYCAPGIACPRCIDRDRQPSHVGETSGSVPSAAQKKDASHQDSAAPPESQEKDQKALGAQSALPVDALASPATTETLPNDVREIYVPAHTIRVREAKPKPPLYACECSVAAHCEQFGGCLAEWDADEVKIISARKDDDREAIQPGDYRYYEQRPKIGSGNPVAQEHAQTARRSASAIEKISLGDPLPPSSDPPI